MTRLPKCAADRFGEINEIKMMNSQYQFSAPLLLLRLNVLAVHHINLRIPPNHGSDNSYLERKGIINFIQVWRLIDLCYLNRERSINLDKKISSPMDYYVNENSIVRKIWGKSDTILFIFAGAAAEFALNKAVDWLYFTGKLPADPIGRLFSTVSYARRIVFSENEQALQAIDKIVTIHSAVEKGRGYNIPDWAYRDVLFMLIHYSIASFELLERKLTNKEKEEVFDVFFRVGDRMGLRNLPLTYENWLTEREKHLREDLQRTHLTDNLFNQYKIHLGSFRYRVLIEAQKLVVPKHVYGLLQFREIAWLKPAVPIYQLSKKMKLDNIIKSLLLPAEYKKEIQALDA